MNYIYKDGELYHYGVKGMKWGVRRKQPKALAEAKAAYKTANKDFNKAYNRAYRKNIATFSPIKKHRQASEERWKDAQDKAVKLKEARTKYKELKKLDRKLRKGFYADEQYDVDVDYTENFSKNGNIAKAWQKAFKAGKGTKEWTAYEKAVSDFGASYASKKVDAWIKDNDVKKVSETGRKYIEDYLYNRL